jgi:redox-sensing transcriptional repressor
MSQPEIPDIIIGRLPIYLRALQRMEQSGKHVTSSQELGKFLRISPPQIRKDLSQFGEFGKQGTGYDVGYLSDQLKIILNLSKVWDVAIVGAGDVGRALARYQGFINRGFKVKYVFDNDPVKIGEKIGKFQVKSIKKMANLIQIDGIKIAMLAVPASSAQDVSNLLIKAGIKAIVNYAPIQLTTPEEVRVQYIDPAIHLQNLTYYLGG